MRLSRWAIGVAMSASMMCTASEILASTGCDAVNAGVFDRTNYVPPGSGVLNTQAGFEIGDKISFTVSGLTGSSFELINGALDTALLIQPLSNSPASVNYTVTGSNNDTTLNTYMLVQAIPYEISITATCVAAVAPEQPSGEISEQVSKSFLINRLNMLLLNQPSGTSLRARGSTSMSGLGALPFTLSATDGHNRTWASPRVDQHTTFSTGSGSSLGGNQPVHFRQTLNGIIRNLNQARDRTTSDTATASHYDLAEGISAPFDAWTEAYYTGFNTSSGNSQAQIKQDGHAFVGYIGTDYRISDRLLFGVLVQLDSTKQTSDTLVAKVKGNGWMSGPYLSARLPQNLFFDLRAAAGRSTSNDLNIAGVTGNFDTTRWLVIGQLSGDWRNGAWRFTPMTDLAYIEEDQKNFTNSRGTVVSGQHALLGRVTFGQEIGYNTQVAGVMVQPYGSLKGIWNFNRSADPFLNGQLISVGSFFGPIGPGFGTFWCRLGAGVGVLIPSGAVFRIGLMYDGVGDSNYQSLTALGQLSIPLG